MADEQELVHLERRDDGVAVVTLDNPKVNALSFALLTQLKAAAEALHADPPGAVVITGGDRIFAAGADISEFGGPHEAAVIGGHFVSTLDSIAADPADGDRGRVRLRARRRMRVRARLRLRIVSERAMFGQPEILLGIIPGGGGTQRLARLVGASRAKDIILTGRQVEAEEALRIGLADEVVAPEELHDRALALRSRGRSRCRRRAGARQAGDRRGSRLGAFRRLAARAGELRRGVPHRGSQIGVKSFLESGPGKARFTGR